MLALGQARGGETEAALAFGEALRLVFDLLVLAPAAVADVGPGLGGDAQLDADPVFGLGAAGGKEGAL